MKTLTVLKKRAGFSIAEVTMSVLIVGILMVVALNTAGAAARSQIDNRDRVRAMLIANGLLAEILEQPFEDLGGSPKFGLENGEGSGDRKDFDDVDDYYNWSSPPETKLGTALPNSSGLTTTAQVALANPTNLQNGAGGGVAQLKWVTVNVLRGAKVIASVNAVVSK